MNTEPWTWPDSRDALAAASSRIETSLENNTDRVLETRKCRCWGRRLGWCGAFVLVVFVTASAGAVAAPRYLAAVGLSRLLPPPDGKAYFGFTFRLWDTTDPAQGDARPFSERIRDSIQYE